MSLTEAIKLVENCQEYIDMESEEKVCLDGWFTLDQLEAIVILKSRGYKRGTHLPFPPEKP
jgi:hypothetical protein